VKPKLVGLTGAAGSGKSTAADFTGARLFSFAEPLKRICKEVFGFTDDQVNGPSHCRNAADTRFPRFCSHRGCRFPNESHAPDCTGVVTYLTPRFALQTLGTEWGRNCYPNVWAELGVRKALESGPGLAVITDVRFVNEARAIRAAGGEVWRIVRRGQEVPEEVAAHASEQEMRSPEMDALVNRTIVNRGTLEDFRAHVRFAVRQFLDERVEVTAANTPDFG
jgi:hypothetical protein